MSDKTPFYPQEAGKPGTSLEELTQFFLGALEDGEEAKFRQSAVAWAIVAMQRKSMPKGQRNKDVENAPINHLSQVSHLRRHTIQHMAEVYDYAGLCENRPTLLWLHLSTLVYNLPALRTKGTIMTDEDEWAMLEYWANRIVDEEMTPAQLRREINLVLGRKGDDASVIVYKARSSSDRMKTIVDEAQVVGVLGPVAAHIANASSYAEEKIHAEARLYEKESKEAIRETAEHD